MNIVIAVVISVVVSGAVSFLVGMRQKDAALRFKAEVLAEIDKIKSAV